MNSSSKASFSFFLVFMLLSTLCFQIAPAFDYYILATQWASTFCTPRSRCIPNIPRDFVIHGLWPSNNNGHHPQDCNLADKFDYQNVVSLEPRLSQKWPDLLGSHIFWSKQWEKHGTCSGLSQLDYFDKALNVFDDIEPLSGVMGIKNKNYVPGSFLFPGVLVNEWGNQYGYFPKITCYYYPRLQLLFELHYNVSKDVDPSNGKLQPQSIIFPRNRNTCRSRGTIYFPN
ncbi:hypothetical protein AQUCO_00400612v1 [Aquilegia coerulea]|uniref:Uncharacterized protein n=1 Tax=Aquilegia coerulea TaxID=218851 RepID=A0A2G5EVV6_AQUCA|nr:hypothetical protein AQUCO_00400612v1 [Aquilegia coerulea]